MLDDVLREQRELFLWVRKVPVPVLVLAPPRQGLAWELEQVRVRVPVPESALVLAQAQALAQVLESELACHLLERR